MAKKQQFDVLVFDLDGTLSDPLEGIGGSINFALEHFGYPTHPLADLAKYIGPPLFETFRELLGVDEDTSMRLVEKYRERYATVGYAENFLYPGVKETLAKLGAAKVPMGICTAKRLDFAERILDLFEIRHHFQFVDGGDSHTPKWQQMERLVSQGKVTTQSLMIGDRAFDMIAAHRNGLTAAGVLWGYGTREELASESAEYFLTEPHELLQWA